MERNDFAVEPRYNEQSINQSVIYLPTFSSKSTLRARYNKRYDKNLVLKNNNNNSNKNVFYSILRPSQMLSRLPAVVFTSSHDRHPASALSFSVVIIGCYECQLTSTFFRHFPDYPCHLPKNKMTEINQGNIYVLQNLYLRLHPVYYQEKVHICVEKQFCIYYSHPTF